jgi:two-component system sensor histidine kinase DegS
MSNVVIMTEICEKTAELDMGKALIELQKLKAVVRDCLKSVRRIIYDLRPMSIDDLGFTPTIQKYIEKFSAEHNIRVDFKVNSEEDCIKDSNIALAVFRIVQESLNNTYKHADATHVSIQVECAQNSVLLRISDDGNGFDTNILSNSLNKEDSGFGILGMRERVELLEGEFIIDSKINVGTIIRVKLPYSLQEET